jgi:N-hydroxyarylamine O-acetyltransferase
MRADLVEAVLARLDVERPSPDLEGLRTVYGAWCRSVPFDNTRKLIHLSEGLDGPLPGSTAEDFFDAWLRLGTGGTCWAGNGALHELLAALGFQVDRGIATMLLRRDAPTPNHGTVIVTAGGRRYVTDASILSGEPLPLLEPGDPPATGPLPRLEWVDGKPAVMWRMVRAPDGFPCRIDRIGAEAEEFDELHRRTRAWSPFNYMLTFRLVRGATTVGIEAGQRFVLRDPELEAEPLEGEERARYLAGELGIDAAIAARVPPDRPIPPRPESD